MRREVSNPIKTGLLSLSASFSEFLFSVFIYISLENTSILSDYSIP